MNDTQRVLKLFRSSEGRVIRNNEIIQGNFYGTKPVLEYTGRMSDARKIIDCTCGQDKDSCTALEHIISIGNNKFIYKKTGFLSTEKPKKTYNFKTASQEIDASEQLRKLEAKLESEPNKKQFILMQIRMVKNVIAQQTESSELINTAKGALL